MPATTRIGAPVVVTTVLAIAIGLSTGKTFTDSDTGHYLRLAQDLADSQPFAARQLAPLIVRAFTHLGLSLHTAFLVLGIASLAFFVSTISFLLEQAKAPAWLRCSILGLYFWGLLFGGLVPPDLFYAALLCGFLLLVRTNRLGWAAGMLFPLMLARESTILVLLCWLYVGWRTLHWSKRLGSVAAVAAGATIVRFLALSSSGNREGLFPVLYLFGKMPWNLAKNVLGIEPWANLNQPCAVPAWHFAVRLGALHDIGYCRIEPEYPVRLVAYALGTFGLLPLLLWWVRKAEAASLLVRFCLLYGTASFLIAGLLGYSVQRLYGYGWPAFLITLPLLVQQGGFRSARWAGAFVGLHLLSSWLEWRVDKLPLLGGEIALWALGFLVLKYGWSREPGDAPQPLKTSRKPHKML